MRIVELGERDIAEAVAIKQKVFTRNFDLPPLSEEKVKFALRRGRRRAFGIRENGKLASVIYVTRNNQHTWFIPSVATLPEAQGRGFGAKLLQKVISLAQKNNITTIGAVVSPRNRASMHLLEKHGFEKKKFLPDHFGRGKHRWKMRLKL